ncbi:hypothetical protein LTR70_008081 [Exophiala xenobiotica]|uniref:Uncharacterized protein n=1 Tax=Lithohypha guttulata TaxID=1690604 RepID=A0ABR0K3N3_9EURO|nr:hypothetical protein LTR24_007198 [Lithohypha guttulata]KAK5312638.1 hypothetical protein LTR70_008081 [Exophiala xenobiotica]
MTASAHRNHGQEAKVSSRRSGRLYSPANKCRALDIPPGRVAQRLQVFQSRSSSPTTLSREIPQAPVSTPLDPPPPILSPTPPKNDPVKLDAPAESQEIKRYAEPAKHEEVEQRGRTLQRASDTELSTEDEDQVDVLDDVRSRLYSVQSIVRRERSGSSQARDELMNELGSMLDNAIATTLSPLTRSPQVPPRSSSSKMPSPMKQTLPQASLSRSESLKSASANFFEARPIVSSAAQPSPKQPMPQANISRSQSLKVANPKPTNNSLKESSPLQSPTKTPTMVPPPERISVLPSLLSAERGPQRHRQTSEPLDFVARRTGFPLVSPVRERALLWESMSQGTVSARGTPKSASHIAHFRPMSPRRSSPERLGEEQSTSAIPPIPLALPQLLEAEKRQQQARFQEELAPSLPQSAATEHQEQEARRRDHLASAPPELVDVKEEQQDAILQEEVALIPCRSPDSTKGQRLARLPENVTPPSEAKESRRASSTDSNPRPISGEWPGQLRLRDVGVGTPTVQETPSVAQAAEHDEHHQKPRPSVIRTTIMDLLSATRRKVSGKGSQPQPPTNAKDKDALVKESELRGSIADVENIDARHLPPLQATPDEVANIQSTDDLDTAGTNSISKAPSRSSTSSRRPVGPPERKIRGMTLSDRDSDTAGSQSIGTGPSRSSTFSRKLPVPPGKRVHSLTFSGQDLDATSTNASGKEASRSSTFSHELATPSEQKVRSPVKPAQTTPVRGRARETHSPGGRPFAIDQRFALSSSRSNSRGSRGSLTFNIKARVSPGRGLRKDDTELFVTANIESDHSDEGS